MKWLSLFLMLLVPIVSNADDYTDKQFSKDDCEEIYNRVQFLV